MTESININSLYDPDIWSTIKTLPATLPEPSYEVRGWGSGVNEVFSQSNLDIAPRVGADFGVGATALGLGSVLGADKLK